MITAVSTGQELNLPIYGFSSEGYLVYPNKVNDHFLWDVPEAHMCNPDYPYLDDTDYDEDFEIMRRRRRRKKKPSTLKPPCRPYSSGPPDDPELDQSLPIYKKALRQLQRESSFKPVPAQPKIQSCLMFSSSSQSYQESFPPRERHTDPQTKVVSQPYVQSSITSSGAPEAPKQYEAVLNWQTQNASAQNQALHHLDSESQYADISSLLMATKTEDPSTSTPVVDIPIAEESSDDNANVKGSQTEPVPSIPSVYEKSSKPSSCPWFTFDDIPRHKWQARHQEFAAWIDVQMTSPTAQSERVLSDIETSRKEYHQMKCCSLNRNHLEMHYKRMSMLYYKLNGFNDPSLKYVFAASLPSELQPELQRQLTTFNLDIANVSLGKIFQLTMFCLDKISKVVRLIQHLQQSSILSDNDEVESIFSEQSEKDYHTAFILADSTDSDPDDISVISTVQEINHIRPTLPSPLVKISVIPSKFHKPVSVIGFLGTSAQCNMLNPKILPQAYWDNHTEYFKAANGKVFETSLITKKSIGIQFFPNCIIWQKIVGLDLPDKDLLIEFNILQLKAKPTDQDLDKWTKDKVCLRRLLQLTKAEAFIGIVTVGFWEKGFGELWMLTVGTTARGIRTISSVSWPRFIHGWLWKLLEMLAEGKEGFLGVLGVLEKKVSVVWLFFFDNDSRGFWFGYGGWSGDHEKVMLWA
ncbi:hypothetical protein KPL71_008173 [Citrus sinensis]|uniref:Uncharacterized protein n=1 Tax=Citrus sinensis TaxID=2711 RepID=A0ACB8M4G5_CITSI|nr:hypothetical protein KPL71_008173 [Citrus sinensis]